MNTNRKNIIRNCIIAVAVLALIAAIVTAGVLFFKKNANFKVPLNVSEETLHVEGLNRAYTIYFLADSHITLTDERDPEEIREKENLRGGGFSKDGIPNYRFFDAMIADAKKENADVVILGGDIIDSAMYASVEHVQKQLSTLSVPCYYLTGNHDFEYGDQYFSQVAYEDYLPRLNEIHGDKSFHVAEYEDLILFTADDSNNQITEEAYEQFLKVLEKGKPVVVSLHVPLEPDTGDDSFLQMCKDVWKASDDGHSRVSIGPNGCYMNDTTREFYNRLVKEDSPVVLVLAGHVHFYHKDRLNDNALQIVTGAAYEGNAVKIELLPPER